jgi:hypothetical protein
MYTDFRPQFRLCLFVSKFNIRGGDHTYNNLSAHETETLGNTIRTGRRALC